ncbi:MAG: ribbon-helix-helix protein, CopG family [Sphingomonas sp.]|jgi:predicted transcriptional regulator|uniref:CopG family ribbon-helix-helix protein n=1 Tax=Sphingomonas sp. TaxID=28214 RepID=UPI003566D9C1
MSKTAVITTRLDEETLKSLDALAESQERTRAWLVAKAVKRYVEEETEFRAFVQAGVDSADRGALIDQEEMETWFEQRRQLPAAAE